MRVRRLRIRQDDEVGNLAVLDPLAQRARGTEIQIELVAALALELGAEGRDHRLHGARTHYLDVSHGHPLPIGADRDRAK